MTKAHDKNQEKFNQLINDTFSKLADAYLERLTDPTVEIDEVYAFGDDLKHRWKTFCVIKRLNRTAFFALDKFIDDVNEKQKAATCNELKAPEPEPQPQPETVK